MSHVLSCPYMKNNCTPLNLCEDCRDDAALDAAAFRDFMVETDRQIAPSDYAYFPAEYDAEISYSLDALAEYNKEVEERNIIFLASINEERTAVEYLSSMIRDALTAEDWFDIDELDQAR